MARGPIYTPEEDQKIREAAERNRINGHNAGELRKCAERLGRPYISLRNRAQKLQAVSLVVRKPRPKRPDRHYRRWKPWEDRALEAASIANDRLGQTSPGRIAMIAAAIGRSPAAARARGKRNRALRS